MNYIKNLLLIFNILLIFTNFSYSEEKIAFINVDYLIQNSIIGKKMLANINELDKKNISDLKKKNMSLKDLEKAIKNKKNIISEKAFNEEVVSFQKKVQQFTKEKNNTVKEFNNFKKKELENIFNKITPLINDYMEENSISILLDSKNIFMGSKKSNLTEDILDIINKKFK